MTYHCACGVQVDDLDPNGHIPFRCLCAHGCDEHAGGCVVPSCGCNRFRLTGAP